MSKVINIHEAKSHLSRIIDEVAAGAEFIIAKAAKPMARLSPIAAKPRRKKGAQCRRCDAPQRGLNPHKKWVTSVRSDCSRDTGPGSLAGIPYFEPNYQAAGEG
jgi:prevent-host-death family protein